MLFDDDSDVRQCEEPGTEAGEDNGEEEKLGTSGNSFSISSAERLEHRFRLDEDIVLLAEYYGDGMLTLPPRHIFETEKYMEKTGEIWRNDSCVILVHLIVSDKPAEELRGKLDELVGRKIGEDAAQTENVLPEESSKTEKIR